jgi:hypothetical protein
LHFEPLHQPYFFYECFQDRISWNIRPGWLQTSTLLICASWVARITGVSHQHLACCHFLLFALQFTLFQWQISPKLGSHMSHDKLVKSIFKLTVMCKKFCKKFIRLVQYDLEFLFSLYHPWHGFRN